MTRPPPRSTLFPYTTLFRSTEDLQPLDLRSAETVSKWLHHGGLYPQFGGPSGIFTVIMRGKELGLGVTTALDRKSTRLNSSHSQISYAVFCLKKKKKTDICS